MPASRCCVYDNPDTYQRECWQDGRLLCAYSADLLQRKDHIPGDYFFFGANIGPWKTGRLVGDKEALPQEEQ